ncbi:unnamed protein product [Auanema sp. JU1783]|nr:unnamed protein product [Auanema sp. JU1783]
MYLYSIIASSSDGMADQPSTSQSIPSYGASGHNETQSQSNAADVENVEIANEIYAEISPVPANFDPLYSNTADGEQTNIPSLYGEVSQIPQGCELCENMRSSCRRIMDSFYLMAKRSANYEEIKEENSNLRRQLGDTNKFVEDRLKDVFSLQTELSTLRVDAGLAKQREEDLLKQIQILEAKAKESREHAHAANVWREKYSRSVEVAEQLQNKRLEIDKKLRDVIEIASSNKKKKEDFEHQAETLKKEKKELTIYNGQSKKALPKLFQLLDELVNESLNLPLLLSRKIEKVRNMSSRAFLLNLKEHSDTGSDDDALELESLLNHSAVSASTSTKKDDVSFINSFSPMSETPKSNNSNSTFVNQDAINASARKSHYGTSHAKTPKFKHISKPEPERTPASHIPSKYLSTAPVPVSNQPESKLTSVVNTIHGKKGKTVREIQEEQRFKGSVKERVAEMKRLKELEKVKGDSNDVCRNNPHASSEDAGRSTYQGTTKQIKSNTSSFSVPAAQHRSSLSGNAGEDLDFEDIGDEYFSVPDQDCYQESETEANITTTGNGVFSTLADDLNMSVSDIGSAVDSLDIMERTAEEIIENVIEGLLSDVEKLMGSHKTREDTLSTSSLPEGIEEPLFISKKASHEKVDNPKKIIDRLSDTRKNENSNVNRLLGSRDVVSDGSSVNIPKHENSTGSKAGSMSARSQEMPQKPNPPNESKKDNDRSVISMKSMTCVEPTIPEMNEERRGSSKFDRQLTSVENQASLHKSSIRTVVGKRKKDEESKETDEATSKPSEGKSPTLPSEPALREEPHSKASNESDPQPESECLLQAESRSPENSMIDMLLSFNDSGSDEVSKLKRNVCKLKTPCAVASKVDSSVQKRIKAGSEVGNFIFSTPKDIPASSQTIRSKWADGAKRALDIMNRINEELQPVLDSIPLSPKMKMSFDASTNLDTSENTLFSTSGGLSRKNQQTEELKNLGSNDKEIAKDTMKSSGTAKRVSRINTVPQSSKVLSDSKTSKLKLDQRDAKRSSLGELTEEDESITARLRRRAALSIAQPQKIVAVPNPSTVPNTKTGESLLKCMKPEEKRLDSSLRKQHDSKDISKSSVSNNAAVPSDAFSGLRKNTRTRVTASKKTADPVVSNDLKQSATSSMINSQVETNQESTSSTSADTDDDSDLEIADLPNSSNECDQTIDETAGDAESGTTSIDSTSKQLEEVVSTTDKTGISSVSESYTPDNTSQSQTDPKLLEPHQTETDISAPTVNNTATNREQENCSKGNSQKLVPQENINVPLPRIERKSTIVSTDVSDLHIDASDDDEEEGLTLDIDDEEREEPVAEESSKTPEAQESRKTPEAKDSRKTPEAKESPKTPEVKESPKTPEVQEDPPPRMLRTRQSSTLKKEGVTPKTSPRKKVVPDRNTNQSRASSSAKQTSRAAQRPSKNDLSADAASCSKEEDNSRAITTIPKKSARPSKIYDISLLNKFTQSLGRGGRLLSTRSKKPPNAVNTKEKKSTARESILLDIPKTPIVRQTADRKGLKRMHLPGTNIPIAKRGKRSQGLSIERSEGEMAKEFFLNAGLYLINMRTSKDNAVASVIETYLTEEQLASIKQLSIEDLGSVLVEIVYNMKNVDLFHQVKLSFQERSIKEIRNKEEEHVLELAYLLANGNIFISFVRSLVQRLITQETINPNQCASYARLMSHALLFDCANVEEDLRASDEERSRLVRTFFNTIFWKHKACISHALIFWLIGNSWELLKFLADDPTLKKLIVAHVEKYEREIIQWAWASRFGEASAKAVIPDDVSLRIEEWIAEEKMNMEELIPTETAFLINENDQVKISPEVSKSLRMQAVLYNSTNLPPDLCEKHLNECSSLFQEALNDLITSLSTGDTSALFADTTNTKGRSLTAVKVHELCVNIKSFESIIGHSLLERESTKYRRSLDIVSRTLNNIRFIRNTLREDPDIPFSNLLSSVINTYITLAQTFTSHTI